jgi:hypothetical protein
MVAPQPIENQQHSYEIFEQKHWSHVQGVRLNHTIFAREERAARVGNGTAL